METSAGVGFAECEVALGKQSRKTCSRTEGSRRQYERCVFFIFCVGEKRSKCEIRAEKTIGKKRSNTVIDVEDDESAKVWCRKPDTAFSSARTAESPSDSYSLGGIGACEIQSTENAPVKVMKGPSSTSGRKDITANCSEYAKARFRGMWLCPGKRWGKNRKDALLWKH